MSELIGVAITRKIMGKMEEIESANVSISSGIEGDARGKKEIDKLPFYLKMIGMMLVKISTRTFTGQERANLFVKGMRGPQKEISLRLVILNSKLVLRLIHVKLWVNLPGLGKP